MLLLLALGCAHEIHEMVDTTTLDRGYADARIRVEAGDVEVYPVQGDLVELEATLRWHRSTPDVDWEAEGETLVVTGTCSGRDCSTSLRIGLPPGATLDIETGAGDVDVQDVGRSTLVTRAGDVRAGLVAGELEAMSGAGDIEVGEVDGDVRIDTDAGDVWATGLASGEIEAWSGAGDVVLFVQAADEITVGSGAGDVGLTVPGGAWRIEASTGAGDVETSGVTDDDDASRSIEASSGAGDVVLQGT